MTLSRTLTVTIAIALLAGCAADDPNRRAKTGAAIGAVVGGIAGNQIDDEAGTFIGAAVGAVAGGAVGNYMDKQKRELEEALSQERSQNELGITELPDGSLKVGIASQASFDVDSAQIKPAYFDTYSRIAQVLRDYGSTVVHVVGHTDNTGSAQYNQQLSERRAEAVADQLIRSGVDPARLRSEGRGLREPVADNATAAGRERNRRVDIVIKPIVQGQEQRAYTPPPYLGR